MDGAETDGTLKAGSEIEVTAKLTNKGSEPVPNTWTHRDRPPRLQRERIFVWQNTGWRIRCS